MIVKVQLTAEDAEIFLVKDIVIFHDIHEKLLNSEKSSPFWFLMFSLRPLR